MDAILLPDGSQYAFDDGAGVWRHIPDPDTAAALGVDENALQPADSVPGPIGDDWGSVDGGGGSPSPSSSPSSPASYDTSQALIAPDGAVYTFDGGAGAWRHIPDPATANAMGLNWSALTSIAGPPSPLGSDWPSVTQQQPAAPPPAPAPAPTPAPAPAPAPPSFVWGGITWTSGMLTRFVGYLAAHGSDYSSWAVNHPDAAAIFTDTYPGGTEPVPKSVGEALGTAIANGETPAQAAAGAAALAASQIAQGFGAPTGAQLLQAAQDVADAYAAAGGVASSSSGGAAGGAGSGGSSSTTPATPDRTLLGITTSHGDLTAATTTKKPPPALQAGWRDLINVFRHTVPDTNSQLQHAASTLKGAIT